LSSFFQHGIISIPQSNQFRVHLSSSSPCSSFVFIFLIALVSLTKVSSLCSSCFPIVDSDSEIKRFFLVLLLM
jgi:hypothetical protein